MNQRVRRVAKAATVGGAYADDKMSRILPSKWGIIIEIFHHLSPRVNASFSSYYFMNIIG